MGTKLIILLIKLLLPGYHLAKNPAKGCKRKLRGEFPFDHNPAKAETLYQARED